jgi:choline dehydrogenase
MSPPTPDVIIVGAGSSGLMCALGLADSARVTLIEGGPDPGTPTPDRMRHEHLYPDLDWGYVEADRGYALPRGRVIGGCSTTNASAAVRGQPGCFAPWGPGWSWDDCLPAFRAIERDVQFGSEPYHGDAGPVRITRLPQSPIDDAFAAACRRNGHADAPDHNAPGSMGVGPWPTNRDEEGGRAGTLAAVMPLVRDRIRLLAGTTVHRVVIEGGRAVGVQISGPGGAEVLRAGHVVLAGGAFGTPEVLMRSGVGPAAALAEEGIEALVDLPGVGANLQDHPWVLAARPVSGSLLRFAIDGSGEGQVFPFQTALYEPGADVAEVSVAVSIMAPRSRGSVRLRGGSLEVRLGHLTAAPDLDALCSAVRHAAVLLDEMAGEGVLDMPPGAWWRAPDLAASAVDAHSGTYNHPVGTCAIGADDDPLAVVGPDLLVRGVEGLSIADASVMPVIPQSNTNLASMMIGARAAGMVPGG